MNCIAIHRRVQLQDIIASPIMLTGNIHDKDAQDREIYENMWALSFRLKHKISRTEIVTFINTLIRKKQEQTVQYQYLATFYIWYSKQSNQLRFNLLSGHLLKLPFG